MAKLIKKGVNFLDSVIKILWFGIHPLSKSATSAFSLSFSSSGKEQFLTGKAKKCTPGWWEVGER